MAQYYQVLSQNEKNTMEELRQYYPNIVENQNVQYVIHSDDQSQQIQGQQILLSSEPLMVIENATPQVVVDQSAVYQAPQYLLRENTVDYQTTATQQVFYMEQVDKDRQIQTEPLPQVNVLNHQLQYSQIQNQVSTPKPNTEPQLQQPQILPQSSQIQNKPGVGQLLQQRTTLQQQRQLQMMQQGLSASQQVQVSQQPQVREQVQQQNTLQQADLQQQSTSIRILQGTVEGTTIYQPPNKPLTEVSSLHLSQSKLKKTDIPESDGSEAITLSDGRIMILTDYNKMVAETKPCPTTVTLSQNNQQRIEGKYKTQTNAQNNNTPTKAKPNRQSNKGRARKTLVKSSGDNNGSQYSVLNNSRTIEQQQNLVNQETKPANQLQPKADLGQNQYSQMQSQQHPQYVQPQYVIHPPSHNQHQVQYPLPSYVASSQIQQIIENTPIGEEYSDSIRMLVLLENGEQRLITFTLPKEYCTIQEILEQVGVTFHPDTRIECTETNSSGINYLVTVGKQHHECDTQTQDESEETLEHKTQKSDASVNSESMKEIETVEPPVEIEAPRYVPGLLAVCNHCGYTSENFNRCLRCRFKLPEDVKTRPASINNKKDLIKLLPSSQGKRSPKNNVSNKLMVQKKKKPKAVDLEPVVLTLSSDDEQEDGETSSNFSETDQIIKRLSNSAVTLSAIKKEPSVTDIQQNSTELEVKTGIKGCGNEEFVDATDVTTTLLCRTIRIGSYRYIPIENLIIMSSGIILKVPLPKEPNEIKTIKIERKHMVKVLVNFQKALPVVFYYVDEYMGQLVREQLGMVEGSDIYFDPVSNEEPFKRITVLPENVGEDTKTAFKAIYGRQPKFMEELTTKEANDILVKTCPKELSKVIANSGYTEIRQLLIYPPGKGGLPINTEDYLCLAQDQFLNDVIIDFYLKYLLLNLPKEKQEKIHIFSTFFYKRLTTKPVKASRRSHPAELDPTLTAAQKRHARVEKWTKNVNLFEKDFIIIPINESCHWFLAIVCFPGLNGCQTMDGKPIKLVPRKTKSIASTATPKPEKKEEKLIVCDDGDASDRDEAEANESELENSEEDESLSTESTENETISEAVQYQPIKQPCILIFDSLLAGASRARVVATLRDYLSCEYKAKLGKERIFNKDVIRGSCPKVPQQTNFTDCGLYLLQYVEEFFKQPLKDYHIPIKELKEWFEEAVVTRKREDISLLIKELMIKYNKDPSILPYIVLPTLNGKEIVYHPEDEDELLEDAEEEEEEDEEFMGDGEEEALLDHLNDTFNSDLQMECDNSDKSLSHICISLNSDKKCEQNIVKPLSNHLLQSGFVEELIENEAALKPSLSETEKRSQEALSYLKSKRINRHKNVCPVDAKKLKQSIE